MHSVVVVSEVAIFREGIGGYLLTSDQNLQVTAARFNQRHPAVVGCSAYVVDCVGVAMIEAERLCRALLAHGVPTVVCGLPDDESVVLAYLEAGASAYVTKEAPLAHLLHTVLTTIRDGACVDAGDLPAILARIRQGNPYRVQAGGNAELTLTAREQEVVDLLARHLSNKEIAAALGISVNTVKHHVHNVLTKLGTSRRSSAAEVFQSSARWGESALTTDQAD